MWVITGAYVIAGLLTGLSAILFAFYTNSVSPSN
jgi:ribose transport system permease protein